MVKPTKEEVQETLNKLMGWKLISPGAALLAMEKFEALQKSTSTEKKEGELPNEDKISKMLGAGTGGDNFGDDKISRMLGKETNEKTEGKEETPEEKIKRMLE